MNTEYPGGPLADMSQVPEGQSLRDAMRARLAYDEDGGDTEFGPLAYKNHSAGCRCPDCGQGGARPGMDAGVTAQLNRVYAAVDHVAQLDGQDQGLAVAMSQAMLNDLIETGGLAAMAVYVGRFCDAAEDAERIAEDI